MFLSARAFYLSIDELLFGILRFDLRLCFYFIFLAVRSRYHSLNLNQEVAWQLACLDRRPCGLGIGQQRGIDGVHGLEVTHVGEEDGRLEGKVPGGASFFEETSDGVDDGSLLSRDYQLVPSFWLETLRGQLTYSLRFNAFRDGPVDGRYGSTGVNKILGHDGASYENRVSTGNFEADLEHCPPNLQRIGPLFPRWVIGGFGARLWLSNDGAAKTPPTVARRRVVDLRNEE
jgi:hypothetical protein